MYLRIPTVVHVNSHNANYGFAGAEDGEAFGSVPIFVTRLPKGFRRLIREAGAEGDSAGNLDFHGCREVVQGDGSLKGVLGVGSFHLQGTVL